MRDRRRTKKFVKAQALCIGLSNTPDALSAPPQLDLLHHEGYLP
jgi:hypothetical protein